MAVSAEPSANRTEPEQPIVNIIGELVALGPMRRELIPLYQQWVNDFGTVRNLGVPPIPMTFEAETSWYDGLLRAGDREMTFTIYERKTWLAIGTAGLHAVDYRNRTAEFGIMIGEVDARGRGYGSEATRLMLDYAFTALGLHNVMLRVFAFNLAGLHAYQRAGFREMGRRRESILMAGKLWDVIYMECLANEFVSPVLASLFAPDDARPTRELGQ
jgi:RimJ/RimL family protein N-acetyltransferase